MMRLYPRRPGTGVVNHGGVQYKAGGNGGFDFPDEVSDALHSFAVRGEKLWETDIERQRRLLSEEMDRRRDPASLYDAVEKIMRAAEAAGQAETAKPSRAKAAADK
jgi:hypothetical protein